MVQLVVSAGHLQGQLGVNRFSYTFLNMLENEEFFLVDGFYSPHHHQHEMLENFFARPPKK